MITGEPGRWTLSGRVVIRPVANAQADALGVTRGADVLHTRLKPEDQHRPPQPVSSSATKRVVFARQVQALWAFFIRCLR